MTPAPLVDLPSETAVPGAGSHWLAPAAHEAFPAGGGGPEQSGLAACALTGDAEAVADARHFTARTLAGWGLAALVDDASVIVSELLGNALRHGLASAPGDGADLGDRPIRVGLLRRGGTVLCAVCDPGTAVPVLKDPGALAESGRGLKVVDSLSDSWGWTVPDRHGKTVWAAVSAPG